MGTAAIISGIIALVSAAAQGTAAGVKNKRAREAFEEKSKEVAGKRADERKRTSDIFDFDAKMADRKLAGQAVNVEDAEEQRQYGNTQKEVAKERGIAQARTQDIFGIDQKMAKEQENEIKRQQAGGNYGL